MKKTLLTFFAILVLGAQTGYTSRDIAGEPGEGEEKTDLAYVQIKMDLPLKAQKSQANIEVYTPSGHPHAVVVSLERDPDRSGAIKFHLLSPNFRNEYIIQDVTSHTPEIMRFYGVDTPVIITHDGSGKLFYDGKKDPPIAKLMSARTRTEKFRFGVELHINQK